MLAEREGGMNSDIPATNKSKIQRLRDCESHLYFLWDARRLFPQQQDRYKQIAAELRVLVCKFGSNKPLLLDLMDEYGFSYEVQPPGPPFDKQPIAMVDDPVYNELSDEITEAAGNPERLNDLLNKQAALRRPVPFREFVARGLAVYVAPQRISYQQLTRAIAEKMGSSHEDADYDEDIAKLRFVELGGVKSYLPPLIVFADLVIEVGSMFLGYLVQKYEYKPRYFDAS